MRVLLTLVVLVVDAWAIYAILGSALPRARKLGWTIGVVGIPVLGALAWWRHERSFDSRGR